MNKKLSTTLVLLVLVSLISILPSNTSGKENDDASGSSSNSGSGSSGTSQEQIFEKDLMQGMRDDDVVKLQEELSKEGLFKVQPTGFFGSITQEAVREFQKEHGLPETGNVDSSTRNELNVQSKSSVVSSSTQISVADALKQIQALMEVVKNLQVQLQQLLNNQGLAIQTDDAQSKNVSAAAQVAAGIIITGAVSGPGYPTGPLNMIVPATQTFLDRIGQVKGAEVKDRQYEVPLETIPPTLASIPVTINGVANIANELKVISNLKVKNGVGQHQGTIDVDIDTIPAGHVTLAYNGTATVVGSTITSKGTFKTTKTTGIFAGLIAEGNYEMTIIESGQTFGSPVTISITTISP